MTLPLLVLAILLQAGSEPQTKKFDFNFDREIDLTDYSTYAWNKDQERVENLANHLRLINAIQAQMKEKGFRIDTIKPEARIRYRVERHSSVQGRSTQKRSLYDPSQVKVQIDLSKEKTVSLTLELVDAEGGFLLWQAKGTYPLGTPDRAERQINDAVEDLFSNYETSKD